MKRKVLNVVLALLATIAFSTPVLASGGMNHGDVGQGATNSHSQPDNLPPHNGPKLP